MSTEQPTKEQTAGDKLALAYAQVLGRDPEHRTDAQKLVMDDMERRGYLHRSTAVPLQSGQVSPVKMEIAEGMRIFLLDTLAFLARAQRLGQVKPKPKTRK
jgi:hypothetical protein